MVLTLSTAWQRAIEVVLPSHCVGCGGGGTNLCTRCAHDAARAAPEPRLAAGSALTSLEAAFAYAGVPRKAVLRLKYNGLRALAPYMALSMAEAVPAAFDVDAVTPVPLHARRLRERGFNQAELLAVSLGELLGLPVLRGAVQRVVPTVPQVELSSAARRRNVRGVFSATPGSDGHGAAGHRVLLVDDVFTTGSTIANAALALKRAGARSVHGLAFAHEP